MEECPLLWWNDLSYKIRVSVDFSHVIEIFFLLVSFIAGSIGPIVCLSLFLLYIISETLFLNTKVNNKKKQETFSKNFIFLSFLFIVCAAPKLLFLMFNFFSYVSLPIFMGLTWLPH